MSDVVVKESSIKGRGVFATRTFRKGEKVLQWNLQIVAHPDDISSVPHDEQKYLAPYGSQFVLLQEPERYVNHSCDANTESRNGADVAVRDISAGEEITANYVKEGSPNQDFICKCGAKVCVGRVRT